MLLRYLKKATLKKATKTKQSNGYPVETYTHINDYMVQVEQLNDEISANVYGANLYKMIRIKSTRNTLEKFLDTKMNNSSDNIRLYYIYIENRKYKINSVNNNGIDCELVSYAENEESSI